MDANDNRQIARDSLFVMAEMRLEGVPIEHRIKVRNLSVGGMMGEGPVRVTRGARVWVNLRNIGWAEGAIAWVQDNRFGIAFCEGIDPKDARSSMATGEHTPRYVRPPLSVAPGASSDRCSLRKI